MPTSIITRAPVHLGVNTFGPFATPSDISLAVQGYQVTFSNTADWPTVGDVATVTVEVSLDHGVNWQVDAGITLGAGPWKNRAGATVNSTIWSVDRPPAANRMRITLQMLQAATIGADVATLP